MAGRTIPAPRRAPWPAASARRVELVQASRSVLLTDDTIIVDSTLGDVTLALPPVSGQPRGRLLRIIDAGGGNSAIVQPAGTDRAAWGGAGVAYNLTAHGLRSVTLIVDGVDNWTAAGLPIPLDASAPLLNTIYADYLVGGLNLGRGASAPALTNFVGTIQMPTFASGGAVESGYFEIHVLHDLLALSTPSIHVHLGHKIAAPGPTPGVINFKVELSLSQGYARGGFPASQTIGVFHVPQAFTGVAAHEITDDGEMPIPAGLLAALEPDSKLIGRLYRDTAAEIAHADGQFAQPVWFPGLDLHYVRGQLGTVERNAPFTAEGFPA